jgi:hypothetical protein
MPAIRSLFSHVFPSIFGTTQRGGKSEYGGVGGGGGIGPAGGARSHFSPVSSRRGTAGGPPLPPPLNRMASTAGGAAIRVQSEWAVMSDPAGNRRDVELRLFEQQVANADAPVHRLKLSRHNRKWSASRPDVLVGVATMYDSRVTSESESA